MQNNLKKPLSLQRWLEIIVGILYLPVGLIFIFISILFIIDSLDSATSITDILGVLLGGSIILLGSIWLTSITIRLILNKQIRTMLDKRLPLWIFILFFIIIPIFLVFEEGTFFENPLKNIIMILVSSSAVGALLLDRKRISRSKYITAKKEERMSKTLTVFLIFIAILTILIFTFQEFFANVAYEITMTEVTNHKMHILLFIGISFFIGACISNYLSWKRTEKDIKYHRITPNECLPPKVEYYFGIIFSLPIAVFFSAIFFFIAIFAPILYDLGYFILGIGSLLIGLAVGYLLSKTPKNRYINKEKSKSIFT